MTRTIVIEGNSVYELDENCMIKKADKCKERQEQGKDKAETKGTLRED